MGMKKLLPIFAALSLFAGGCDKDKAQVADISQFVNGRMASVENFAAGAQMQGGMGFIVADKGRNG